MENISENKLEWGALPGKVGSIPGTIWLKYRSGLPGFPGFIGDTDIFGARTTDL